REKEMAQIGQWIAEVLTHLGDAGIEQRVRKEVADFAARFPLYARRLAEAEAALRMHATKTSA
ncbi:MAG TPA: hypothetical protein VGR55_07745, partial [Candidatus Acidoferrum sp.]|nr:hypothetical protein [Candidatus Acidoferrum sp.]